MTRPIEIELRVRDIDRSRAFYRLIGVPVEEPEVHEGEHDRHAHASWGSWRQDADDFLLLSLYPAAPGEETRVALGFVVDDIDATHQALVDAATEVVQAPERRPWGRMATYRDPDGNSVGLTERPR